MFSPSCLFHLCVSVWIIPLSSLFAFMFSLSHTLVAESHTGVIPDLYQVAVRLCLDHLSLPPSLGMHAWLTLFVTIIQCPLSLTHRCPIRNYLPCFLCKVILLHGPINAYKIQASLCVCRNGVIIFDCLLWETILRLL